MKVNESHLDRIIRVILGIVLFVLYFTGAVTGILGGFFIVIGTVALLTGVVGICPIYWILKIKTTKS